MPNITFALCRVISAPIEIEDNSNVATIPSQSEWMPELHSIGTWTCLRCFVSILQQGNKSNLVPLV